VLRAVKSFESIALKSLTLPDSDVIQPDQCEESLFGRIA
jgi:hypothetical protein